MQICGLVCWVRSVCVAPDASWEAERAFAFPLRAQGRLQLTAFIHTPLRLAPLNTDRYGTNTSS